MRRTYIKIWAPTVIEWEWRLQSTILIKLKLRYKIPCRRRSQLVCTMKSDKWAQLLWTMHLIKVIHSCRQEKTRWRNSNKGRFSVRDLLKEASTSTIRLTRKRSQTNTWVSLTFQDLVHKLPNTSVPILSSYHAKAQDFPIKSSQEWARS